MDKFKEKNKKTKDQHKKTTFKEKIKLTKYQIKMKKMGVLDLSKKNFSILMEPTECDRNTHLKFDKKPFILENKE